VKKKFLENLTKRQLRCMVDKVIVIEDKKLSKMSRNKCIQKLEHLSYSQLLKLL